MAPACLLGIRDIRRRKDGREWEVKLESPVNRVLPVSRSALANLWPAFELESSKEAGVERGT